MNPDYIYNRNTNMELFINYLKPENIIKLINLKLNWQILLFQNISDNETIYDLLLSLLNYKDLITLFKVFKPTNYPLNSLLLRL